MIDVNQALSFAENAADACSKSALREIATTLAAEVRRLRIESTGWRTWKTQSAALCCHDISLSRTSAVCGKPSTPHEVQQNEY